MTEILGLMVIGVLVGVTLTLRIQLPRGGSIPMGDAVVIAVAFQLASAPFALVGVVALAAGTVISPKLHRHDSSRRHVLGSVAGMLAVGVAAAILHPYVPSRDADGWAQSALVAVFAIGFARVAVDLVIERRASKLSWSAALPVYLSLVCSAALIALATGWLLVFAALPLLITWYSFERYSAARRTYEQTIQALGIVPELAGHVGIGHGERTAAYAVALANALDLPADDREVITVAARLHHVGHVAVPDCEAGQAAIEDARVASASARILRDSGFLPQIADLVESLGTPIDDVGVAVVKVASAFDDLVGEDAERGRGALAILQSRSEGQGWNRAVAAFRELLDGDDAVVHAAIAEGAPLTAAAAAAESKAMSR